jgi:glycogen debranching enzyme
MDATALFVLLLVEAYREGRDEERVRALIPHARAALGWMRERSADDPLGFIRYRGLDDGALSHHGWKDSPDAIVDARGVRGPGPTALAEVQAYAIAAASGFAGLLERVEGEAARPEAEELRAWAGLLLRRFVARFEVAEPGREGYFAIALDGRDTPVDGITSNIGHLLGAAILGPQQSAALARHLVSDELFSGWGLRTRGAGHPNFNRLGYHGGAVWAHDTAIAIRGLALAVQEAVRARDEAAGRVCRDAARTLADGLLAAAHAFGYRLPELFGGGPREPGDASPLPFPAACRPQAWSAAAGVAIWAALRRLDELDDALGRPHADAG